MAISLNSSSSQRTGSIGWKVEDSRSGPRSFGNVPTRCFSSGSGDWALGIKCKFVFFHKGRKRAMGLHSIEKNTSPLKDFFQKLNELLKKYISCFEIHRTKNLVFSGRFSCQVLLFLDSNCRLCFSSVLNKTKRLGGIPWGHFIHWHKKTHSFRTVMCLSLFLSLPYELK